MLNGDLRIALGDIVIDREHRRAWCAVTPVKLNPREFALLLVLFEHAPDAVATQQIAALSGRVTETGRRARSELYIGYLRCKLPRSARLELRTQRIHGYALVSKGHFAPTCALFARQLRNLSDAIGERAR